MSTNGHHVAVIDLEAPYAWTLECHAPADADCHIVWDCDCEMGLGFEVRDGVPSHVADDDAESWLHRAGLPAGTKFERHTGRFDPAECSLRYWAQEDKGNLYGEARVPVKEEYGGGYYTFEVAQPTAENIREVFVHEWYRPNAEDIRRAMAGEVLSPDPFHSSTLHDRQVKAVCALLGIPTEEQP